MMIVIVIEISAVMRRMAIAEARQFVALLKLLSERFSGGGGIQSQRQRSWTLDLGSQMWLLQLELTLQHEFAGYPVFSQ